MLLHLLPLVSAVAYFVAIGLTFGPPKRVNRRLVAARVAIALAGVTFVLMLIDGKFALAPVWILTGVLAFMTSKTLVRLRSLLEENRRWESAR